MGKKTSPIVCCNTCNATVCLILLPDLEEEPPGWVKKERGKGEERDTKRKGRVGREGEAVGRGKGRGNLLSV